MAGIRWRNCAVTSIEIIEILRLNGEQITMILAVMMRLTSSLLILISTLLLVRAVSHAQTTCSPAGCGLPDSAIEAHRSPIVRPLQIDEDLLYDRDYRQIDGLFAMHSAPNSSESQNFGAGYTFVTVYEESGDWSRIGDSQWVRSEILSESIAPSRFAGALLPDDTELPYTVAWTLWHLRGSKTPGGRKPQTTPSCYRYSRVYIYSTV